MVKYIFLRNKFLIVFVIALISRNIQAEDLSDIYEMALQNDPILKATEASYRAGKESKSQGLAGLLPTLQVTGSTTWNEYRLEDVKLDEYNSNGYVGSINQPLFRLDKWF